MNATQFFYEQVELIRESGFLEVFTPEIGSWIKAQIVDNSKPFSELTVLGVILEDTGDGILFELDVIDKTFFGLDPVIIQLIIK